jgi:endonuclease YncB( thermonuclease family)
MPGAMLRLVALIFAFIIASAGSADAQLRCRAVDGDTLACGDERVRIMGLDAPEMHGRCPAEIRLSRAARDRMAVLVAGGVSLQPHGRDRYRRLLAVVLDRQGGDVAAVLIREGLARPYGGERRRSWCG